MNSPLHTVVETEPFLRKAKALGLTIEDRETIVQLVANDPAGGDPVVGAGGLRKRRIAGRGHGTSGGFRIMVAYLGPKAPAFILAILSKGERSTFTEGQTEAMRKAGKSIKKALRRRKQGRRVARSRRSERPWRA